jgi:hypothetical protein
MSLIYFPTFKQKIMFLKIKLDGLIRTGEFWSSMLRPIYFSAKSTTIISYERTCSILKNRFYILGENNPFELVQLETIRSF